MWRGEVPQILTHLQSGYEMVSFFLFVPLSEGSTPKNVVILSLGFGLMGG